MKITVIFEGELGELGDDAEYVQLGGKSLTMDGIRDLKLSTVVDIAERPGEHGSAVIREPMDTGSLSLTAHGNRAMFAGPADHV